MKRSLWFSVVFLLAIVFVFSSEILGINNDTIEKEAITIKLSSSILYQPFNDKLVVTTLTIEIENLSDSAIKIIWDETILTDNNNFESGVIHEGTKYIDKNE